MMLEDDIKRLSQEIAAHGKSDVAREAATATSGVPVYSDMGGTLAIGPGGEVLHYNPDTRAVTPVADQRWRTVALSRAAKNFREFASLCPIRPGDAVECDACAGAGMILNTVACGKCLGLGWL
jgi:hypothetical protein